MILNGPGVLRRGNGRLALTLTFKVKRSCRYNICESDVVYCKIEIFFNVCIYV